MYISVLLATPLVIKEVCLCCSFGESIYEWLVISARIVY